MHTFILFPPQKIKKKKSWRQALITGSLIYTQQPKGSFYFLQKYSKLFYSVPQIFLLQINKNKLQAGKKKSFLSSVFFFPFFCWRVVCPLQNVVLLSPTTSTAKEKYQGEVFCGLNNYPQSHQPAHENTGNDLRLLFKVHSSLCTIYIYIEKDSPLNCFTYFIQGRKKMFIQVLEENLVTIGAFKHQGYGIRNESPACVSISHPNQRLSELRSSCAGDRIIR